MGKISRIRQISRAVQGKRSEKARAQEQNRAMGYAEHDREDRQAHDTVMQDRQFRVNETSRKSRRAQSRTASRRG